MNTIGGIYSSDFIQLLITSDELLRATLRGDSDRVAEIILKSHNENASIFEYSDEHALACSALIAYYVAAKDYTMKCEGLADIVFTPRENCTSPAFVVGVEMNKSANFAVSQVKQRSYKNYLQDYFGELLFVGINYSETTKDYSCKIEREFKLNDSLLWRKITYKPDNSQKVRQDMSDFKPIPIGIENFKKLIDEGYYYVDKTLLIRDILDRRGAVNLYTRPRRFGKTLNMSMLQYYFEKTETDNSYLFRGLNIAEAGEKYQAYQGQYPVINISLKSMKQPSYEQAFYEYRSIITNEFNRHCNLVESSELYPTDVERFKEIFYGTAEDNVYINAIHFLSDCLYKVYQKKVIILIDEYDVPLENSYFRGFYNQMTDLIRSSFESALKTNDSLEFGILTGCLRISKESIFTGLNHLKVNSITTLDYSEYFGFTEKEVQKATEDYGISHRFPDMKQWYDGYLFGETEIYNPWSILYFISDARNNHNALIQPYWSNTSSNDIIHDLMINGDEITHGTVEELINGGTVIAPVYEDITYQNINVNSDYIWSFLLFTGYLKQIHMFLQDDRIYAEMCIPNREVRSIYRNTIQQWFDDKVKATSREDLFKAVVNGNCEVFEDILCDWLEESISYYDGKENYYHGFLTGLVSGFKGYQTESNRESGLGRSDIMILERRRHKLAVIIEVKVADKFADLDKKCSEALAQIEEKQYDMKLKQDCYQKILKYGVAFYQKSCCVKLAE